MQTQESEQNSVSDFYRTIYWGNRMGLWCCRNPVSFNRKAWTKFIAVIVLSCFAFSPVVEAKDSKVSGHPSTVKTKIFAAKQAHQRRLAVKKRAQKVAAAKKRQWALAKQRAHQRTLVAKKRAQIAAARKRPHHVVRGKGVPTRVIVIKKPQTPALVNPLQVYLTQLSSHTRRNADIVGLPHLYAQGGWGQNLTIAPIEQSGTWKILRDVINRPLYSPLLTQEKRGRYKKNFLPAIGKLQRPGEPWLDPEEKNNWIHTGALLYGNGTHGAEVSSVLLELAPQAQVLPVSTYNTPSSPDLYDVADAVMDLAQHRPDVHVINISAGHVDFTVTSKEIRDDNGKIVKFVSKDVYTPKLVQAFQAAAQAGKAIVLGSGNEGKDIRPPEFVEKWVPNRGEIMGHLVDALDPETLESVIFAGNLDPVTRAASPLSNKPGDWLEAQQHFLFAPGAHELPDVPGFVVKGTSFAAPAICAGIAAVASALEEKSKVRPPLKVIAKALKNTADPMPEKATYGCGVMNVKRALEKLEEIGY